MGLLFAVSDFSVGEGVYPAAKLLGVARRLGYDRLVLWDRGLHGYPRIRDELDWAREEQVHGRPHPQFQGPGPSPEEFRLHLGCRFTWGGHDYGALPWSDEGYGALNRLLTDQAHGREARLPRECMLLAEGLEGLARLREEGLDGALLAHPRRVREAREALHRGWSVVGPQVLRFRTEEGLELHHLKRAIAHQSTLGRTEALWDPRDAAMPREAWEARFPGGEPSIATATKALQEHLASWSIHWGGWVYSRPLGLEGQDMNALLRARVEAALPFRYGEVRPEVRRRVEHELDLIERLGFPGYFLLVEDLIKGADPGRKVQICGRGSGAASIVSYLLSLSNVDPVGTQLLFERFLTENRKDPPDMDIDFAWDERDGVIASVFERYGRDRVAMVANHVFFKPRSALRAVAQAYGRPEHEMKAMSQRVRGWEGGLDGLQEDDPWWAIVRWARSLVGHFHQFSVHPGGVVITAEPLWKHVAFQPAPAKEGVSITSWDKEGVENYGLVKMDLLGNRSLAVIRDAYAALGGAPAGIGEASRGDPATQALLARGDSIGVFYVESPATRQLQQRVGKGDFESLVIHSSLIRPAAYRWVDRYVRRARGDEAYQPSAPVFEKLLSESYGVLVYQEDVLRVCVELAGWSYAEADKLRKLLGRPDCMARLPSFEAAFREGCGRQGVAPAVAEEAWDMIRTFQGYSFCKPHSTSYAQVSFESAWIKAHHPAIFFASVISNQGGYYPAIAYLGDARRHRLVVRGPDANASAWAYRAEGEGALRVGLMAIKGAIEGEVRGLLANREREGPFEGLEGLLARVPLSLPTVEALGSAGAFDAFSPDGDRTRLLWARLGGVPPGLRPKPTDPFDRADLELETMGITLELHPAALARVRKSGGPQRAGDVQVAGRKLSFWALVVADKVVPTERGEPMQFLTLEDETGLCECVAFPPVIRRRPFRVGEIRLVRGRSTRQDGLAVLEIEPG